MEIRYLLALTIFLNRPGGLTFIVWINKIKHHMMTEMIQPVELHFGFTVPDEPLDVSQQKMGGGWKKADDLIKNMKPSLVQDNFRPWWKAKPVSPPSITKYGTITVK